MNKYYVVHPGYVTYLDNGETEYIDAGTLAALYQLDPGTYLVGSTEQEDSMDGDIIHIHLFPRSDRKYRKPVTLDIDHLDKPVNWRKVQKERRKYV